jgi:hypothetical protein
MATRIWRGDQAAAAQVTTIAVTGTWAGDDTATVTINGKDLTVTIGSNTATTDIVAALVAMVNGAAAVDDESRSALGSSFGEWNGITASANSSTLVLTGDTAGTPFTVTVSESTAGDGALGSPAEATAPAGPNELAAANVTGASLTPTSNNLVFENNAVDCLYGLDQSSAGTWDEVRIRSTYTGYVGLPRTHSASPTEYVEYLDRYLKVNATDVVIGEGTGSGSGRLLLDLGTVQTAVRVLKTGSSANSGLYALQLVATHASNTLDVSGGSVDIAPDSSDSSQFSTIAVSGNARVRISRRTTVGTVTASGSANVIIDQDTSLTDITTINIYDSATVTVMGDNDVGTLNAYGTCTWRSSGTVTQANVGPRGVINVTDSTEDATFTDTTMTSGGQILDPAGHLTFTNAIDLGLAGLDDVTLNLGKGIDILPS